MVKMIMIATLTAVVLCSCVTSPAPGESVKQDPQRDEIYKMAQQAAVLFQEQHPEYTFERLVEAKTQVVAGTNYFLTMEFSSDLGTTTWRLTLHESLNGALSLTSAEQAN